MAELLNTAQGSVPGDVEQIRTAIFGREVRASIAEALELLYAGLTLDESQLTTLNEDFTEYKERMATLIIDVQDKLTMVWDNIYDIGVYQYYQTGGGTLVGFENGKLYMHYADGTTSIDAYNAGVTDVIYKGRRYLINEDGTLSPYLVQENENILLDRLACGYKYRINSDTGAITEILLFDQNAEIITYDENDERQQGCFLYNHIGLAGFVTDLENSTRVYLSDLLNRISALEAEVAALKESAGV